MIIPSVWFMYLGFINQETGEVNEFECQKGNLLLVNSDLGKKMVLRLTGSKKDLTPEEITVFFKKKGEGILKSTEIKETAANLDLVEKYDDLIEAKKAELKATKMEKVEQNKAVKAYKEKLAFEIALRNRQMKTGTVFKAAVSYSENKLERITINGETYPVLESKCILLEEDGTPNAKGIGLYYVSQTANQYPIKITALKKENEFIDLAVVTLAPLATITHFKEMVKHLKRTIAAAMEKESVGYISPVAYTIENKSKINPETFAAVKALNAIVKKGRKVEDTTEYIEALDNLNDVITPNDMFYVHLSLNIMVNRDYFNDLKASSFTKLAKMIPTLNFSSQNPSEKKVITANVDKIIDDIKKCRSDISLYGIYSTPGLKFGEETDSWGFMTNNIQTASLIMDSRAIAKIIMNIQKSISN